MKNPHKATSTASLSVPLESLLIESVGYSEKSTTLNSTRATMKEEPIESHTRLKTAREHTHKKSHSD